MGHRFDELVAAAGPGARTGVITNALDSIPLVDRQAHVLTGFDPIALFRERGLEANELDLRDFFGSQSELELVLSNLRLVWAVGGNSFLLRRAMRQSGFDRTVGKLVTAGRLIYGGWSAGAV